jgi:UDP-GlcNAc:undecaprenyl-phosphate GlcNAc-1-phosphate transferase
VHWSPLLLSTLLAVPISAAVIGLLERAGVVRENYRGAPLPAAAGLVVPATALLALGPLAAVQELADAEIFRASLPRVLVYVLGVATLGLIDDLLGGRAPPGASQRPEAPRGLRGHWAAVAEGRMTTGALKAGGTVGLALFVLSGTGRGAGEYLLAVAVLVLATNFFNLLDLRPGRAGKCFLALTLIVTVATWDTVPLQALGLFIGPTLVLLRYDLAERAMLGDVGSNTIGALAGLLLILALGPAAQAGVLVALVLGTVYGEFRSITAMIDGNPLMRRLDSVGRSSRNNERRPSGRLTGL